MQDVVVITARKYKQIDRSKMRLGLQQESTDKQTDAVCGCDCGEKGLIYDQEKEGYK